MSYYSQFRKNYNGYDYDRQNGFMDEEKDYRNNSWNYYPEEDCYKNNRFEDKFEEFDYDKDDCYKQENKNERTDRNCRCNCGNHFKPCFPCFPCFRPCRNNWNCRDNEWKENNRPCHDRCQENKTCDNKNNKQGNKEAVLFINGRIVIRDC